MKYNLISFILGLAVVALFFFLARTGWATNKIALCHCEPNGNCQTLHLPQQALAGHFDAQGNPLHAGDYLGDCRNVTPTLTPTPTIDYHCRTCNATPTATLTPTASPTATLTPTLTPTSTPSATPTETPRTDLTDGKSDGKTESLGCIHTDCSIKQAFSPYDGAKVILK